MKNGLLILTFCLVIGPPAWGVEAVPDVPFALLRLDYNYSLKQAYRFTQPYRKTLPAHPFVQEGDALVEFVHPTDFGYTEIRSRLTGQRVFRATSVWSGTGRLEWPTAAEEVGVTRGFTVPDPEVFNWWTGDNEARARAAWGAVRDLDVVSAIAQTGPYGVFAYLHQYDPINGPYEWILLVYGRPTAPSDAAVTDLVWPRTLITEGVATTPEVRLHNFSDAPLDVDIEVQFRDGSEVVHTSRRTVEGLLPDTSSLLFFDPMTRHDATPLTFEARLLAPGESDWSDTFADNDALVRGIEATTLPVFRVVGSSSNPGNIPLNGDMADFDGDGDQDVIQHLFAPAFHQNDGMGHYTNVTSRVTATLRPHPRRAHVHDFDGDQILDVLLQYFEQAPILLRGDGTGSFTDVTAAAGLAPYTTSRLLEVLDLEGDGDQDILFAAAAANTPVLNDGAGHFSIAPAGSGLEDGSGQIQSIAAGDLDGDTRPDLVFVRWTEPPVVLRNLGGGAYERSTTLGTEIYGRRSLIFDSDNDGTMDILITRERGDSLFRQVGPFQFEDATAQAGPLGASFTADAHDIDGDGRSDLIKENQGTGFSGLRLLLNGSGTFTDQTDHLVEVRHAYSGSLVNVRFVDFDGDGDRDIYSKVMALENLGLPPQTLSVSIDIRNVNAGSHGLLRVILFGGADFEVADVDAGSLAFGPSGAAPEGRNGPRIADVNRDGLNDLDLRFRTHLIGITLGDVACLKGTHQDGTPFEGCALLPPPRGRSHIVRPVGS